MWIETEVIDSIVINFLFAVSINRDDCVHWTVVQLMCLSRMELIYSFEEMKNVCKFIDW